MIILQEMVLSPTAKKVLIEWESGDFTIEKLTVDKDGEEDYLEIFAGKCVKSLKLLF